MPSLRRAPELVTFPARACYRAGPVRLPCPARLLALAALLAQAACAASLGDAHPCPDPACGDGQICVAGRCRAADSPVAAADAARVVLLPASLAVVASRGGGGGGDELPDTVTIGRGSSGTVVMLLRFEATWRDDAEVASALLVLEPIAGAPPAVSPIDFEMARIIEPWAPAAVSWGRQPRLGVPMKAGSPRARPALPLRIDVTPLVRAWSRRGDDHGIALLAHGDDASGAVISTGVTQGRGPRLEVYVK